MVIGITVNNIIRDHISQLKKIYELEFDESPIEPINPFDLEKSFLDRKSSEILREFKLSDGDEITDGEIEYTETDKNFNVYQFMYHEASFEVFGRSDETIHDIVRKINGYQKKLKSKIIILNKESPRSKCATLFFLSKNGFDLEKIEFPDKYKNFWDNVDVLITDNPKILKTKPEDKISIKVENNFNQKIKSDFSIKDLSDIKNLKKIIKKIQENGKN